ncbi:hypothetical protein [Streptomyces sp. NPDC059455]|uniref:hypothetical protein n=1 Tax=Streptomyces sp. NPDC059455 TaxID=3346837 RepID=UPI0036757E8D
MDSQAGDTTSYGNSGEHVLLRRYTVVPGKWPELLEVMKQIVVVRKRHGFRVVCAFADREENMLTWAIAYSGDIDTAAKHYYEDPDRIALQTVNDYVTEWEVRPVEPIDLQGDPS